MNCENLKRDAIDNDSLVVIFSTQYGPVPGKTRKLVVQPQATFAAFQTLDMPFSIDRHQIETLDNPCTTTCTEGGFFVESDLICRRHGLEGKFKKKKLFNKRSDILLSVSVSIPNE